MKPVAIVTPWFGRELKGGAEQLAWQVAHRLAARNHRVEVLTTCCRSFLEDWSVNHLKPGSRQEDGLIVRRFKVNPRRSDLFNAANTHLLSYPHQHLISGLDSFELDAGNIFVQENIHSQSLLKFIKKKHLNYQALVFLPYLYGPILKGVELAANNSVLQPCLHDEAYAYLKQVDHIFRTANMILYNSAGEQKLAEKLYGPGIVSRGKFVGVGIEKLGDSPEKLPDRIGSFDIGAKEPFILCLGRRDPNKNTDLLVRAFTEFKRYNPSSSIRLALAGPGNISYRGRLPDIFDLGLVNESEKTALLIGCKALFHPSENESYSRVIMEAWFHCKPVVVHRNCLATSTAVRLSRGGWFAAELSQWVAAVDRICSLSSESCHRIALNGHRYAQEYADWEKVLDRYEKILGLGLPSRCGKSSFKSATPSAIKLGSGTPRTIHQLTPGFAYGDAISNQALIIRDYLHRKGYNSQILAESVDPAMAAEGQIFKGHMLSADAGLIYHHSIGSELTRIAVEHPGPKSLIYHNITPPEYVTDNDPELACQLERGRRDLKVLAQHFGTSVGDSKYNALELSLSGFSRPGVLPICVTPDKWNLAPDAHVLTRMGDGKRNILFVGRIIPNKRQDDLVRFFRHYVKIEAQARLVLVGGYNSEDPFFANLLKQISDYHLRSKVWIPGKVSDAQLQAYYRTAHLYLSMSEHEGFGVPLIEAMWFDIPVLAFKSSAVAETMGCGGILFNTKADFMKIALTARMMIKNPSLFDSVVRGQRKRRNDFLPTAVEPQVEKLLARMVTA